MKPKIITKPFCFYLQQLPSDVFIHDGRPSQAAGRRDWVHQIAAAVNKSKRTLWYSSASKGQINILVFFTHKNKSTELCTNRHHQPAGQPAIQAIQPKKPAGQRSSQPAKQPARISKMKNEKWDPLISNMNNEKWHICPRGFSKMKVSKVQ